MKIFSAGQSCFRITLSDGRVIMTDPWLGRSIIKPYVTPIVPEAVERCDLFLVSHLHIDHLDSTALRMAKRLGTTVVGSPKAVRKASRSGVSDTVAMSRGETRDFGGFRVSAVFAEHPMASDAVGFVIESDNTIYFSGDTRIHSQLIADLGKFRIDIALLQIACAVYFFKKDGMDIPDAAKLARVIKPKIAIPMHYHDRMRQPKPEDFREALADTDTRVDILGLGEEKGY